MREWTMLKVGEFARVGQVSIATLHHYDQYGLLKPSALNQNTGYRYYALDQLPRLHRILVLKDLGFPLEKITRLLEDDLSLDQLRGMFTLKQAQIQCMIDTEQARLTQIAARIRQIEQEGIMPVYEVLLKQVEPLFVASARTLIPMGDNLQQLWSMLVSNLDQQYVPYSYPAMLLLHSRYEQYDDGMAIDVEAAIPLSTMLSDNEQITTRTLPGGLMASTVHIGDDITLGQAYAALYRWIGDNGYLIVGPPRQVHHQHDEDMDPDQYITELQFPVKKQDRS